MADEETEETVEELEETVEESLEDDSNDEKGWDRMGGLVRDIVREELGSWSAQQARKTSTSTPSHKRPVKKAAPKPERRKGFLSGGMFKGLGPEE